MDSLRWERRHINGWVSTIVAISPSWYRAVTMNDTGETVEGCEGTQVDMLKQVADVTVAVRAPHHCECADWNRAD